jgi:uncharacterized protein with PIN domain
MLDKTLRCIDCKGEFVFTEREQALFASRTDPKTRQPWTDPIRCKPCRDVRKQPRPRQDQQTG